VETGFARAPSPKISNRDEDEMKTMVSAQIWRSTSGVERVWGLGVPSDKSATPLLNNERHTYVRNEDREWKEYEVLGLVGGL